MMVIMMRAARKKDGGIDVSGKEEVKALPERKVEEVVKVNGVVSVRLDDGEPAEEWDAVTIGDCEILGDKFMASAVKTGGKDG